MPAEKIHFFENDEKDEKSLIISPRSTLSEMRGYLSNENDEFFFLFENGVKLSLDFIDKEKINEVYRNGTHRVKMNIPSNNITFDENGEIEAVYEGEGIYNKDRLSRVELNLNLDYQSSFDSPISHLYIPY